MKEPNERLAEKIIRRLVERELLTETESQKIRHSFSAGRLDQDSWKVALENSMEGHIS